MLVYIHCNPVHHGVSKYFQDYPWSSYSRFLGLEGEKRDVIAQSDDIPTLERKHLPIILKNPKELLIKYFNDEENFEYVHQITSKFNSIEELIIED